MKKCLIFSDYLAETESGWENRIKKEYGQSALNTYLNIIYPDSPQKPITRLTAEEFYLIHRLEKDVILVKELLQKLAEFPTTSDWFEAHISYCFIKQVNAWVSNGLYERREGFRELESELNNVTKVLVNMNHDIDNRFQGNVLCFVMYRCDMELFERLLQAPWLDINAEGNELKNSLFFLLYTWDYYNNFNYPVSPLKVPNKENVISTLNRMFDLMLQKGVDVNTNRERGYTSLMCAAASGNKHAVKIMLDAGADYLRVDPQPAKPMEGWKTAEDFATHYHHTEIAELLKNHKEQCEAKWKSERLKC